MKKLLLIFLLIAAWSVQAREVYPLCDDWLFSFRYENSSDNARCVTLPHTWNLDALAGTIPYLRTTADYQRKLYVPQTWTGKRLFLKFYGVESVAHLFVNGTYVGEHRGGTTAFVFEITDRVKYGSENLLRVAVSNAITGDVLPLSSIHNIYGGISREVELIVTDPTAVSAALSTMMYCTTSPVATLVFSQLRCISGVKVWRKIKLSRTEGVLRQRTMLSVSASVMGRRTTFSPVRIGSFSIQVPFAFSKIRRLAALVHSSRRALVQQGPAVFFQILGHVAVGICHNITGMNFVGRVQKIRVFIKLLAHAIGHSVQHAKVAAAAQGVGAHMVPRVVACQAGLALGQRRLQVGNFLR